MARAATADLRRIVARGKSLPVPGASDALSARLIEAHGYECVYIGSYATAASRLGITDTGLLSLQLLVDHPLHRSTLLRRMHHQKHLGGRRVVELDRVRPSAARDSPVGGADRQALCV